MSDDLYIWIQSFQIIDGFLIVYDLANNMPGINKRGIVPVMCQYVNVNGLQQKRSKQRRAVFVFQSWFKEGVSYINV